MDSNKISKFKKSVWLFFSRFTVFKWQPFIDKVAVVLIFILFLSNQSMAMKIGERLIGSSGGMAALSGDFAEDISNLVVPSSMPFYGAELGLDYTSLTNINRSITKLGVMAPMQGSSPIRLNEAEMKRYIAIGTEPTVTCEFCCGVMTLVREDGSPTCGCAHSIGMRGTVAYLIRNYPSMTNAEISYEIMRQKGMYFPKQMQEKMATQLSSDSVEFTPDIKYLTQNLSAGKLAKIRKQSREAGFVPKENPDMVGGC